MYIDGFNFYYGAVRGTPYKWLNLESLFVDLLSSHHQIVKIKYFTARAKPSAADPHVIDRQNSYFRALKHCCPLIELHFGHFLRHKVRMACVTPPPQTIEVWKTEEKGSDVNLALHVLNDAWLDAYDCAVIVSNDSDLAESLRLVKEQKRKLIGIVTPGAPERQTSAQLKQHSDFIRVMRKVMLQAHQLPDAIPGTNIHKPHGW